MRPRSLYGRALRLNHGPISNRRNRLAEPDAVDLQNDWVELVALKNKYDPTNFFRMNHNIKPTKAATAA